MKWLPKKEGTRHLIAVFSSGVEIVISIVVLVAIVIMGWQVLLEAFNLAQNPQGYDDFSKFLGHAFNLIIGVEFIKMLAKHTPGSAIEVLLFAIARQMVVEHTTSLDNLLGIVAIALIFIIRKYFFVESFGSHHPSGAIEDKREETIL